MNTQDSTHPPLNCDQLDAVARLFRVLSETTRLSLLQILKSGPATVSELMAKTQLKQANVSKQLGLLHAAGLVGRERKGSRVIYSACDSSVFELCAVVCAKLRRDAQKQAQTFGT